MRRILGFGRAVSSEDESLGPVPPKKANRCANGGSVEFWARYGLVGAVGVSCGAGEHTATGVAWFSPFLHGLRAGLSRWDSPKPII